MTEIMSKNYVTFKDRLVLITFPFASNYGSAQYRHCLKLQCQWPILNWLFSQDSFVQLKTY